ncbi:MAG: Gfo/Idh/MocA family oxidoreductase [Betaproteobacteria bacterium]|nr:Gfo/Idh/MocA family oxidoreductase [Betaproteobacteria bacterium]
MKQVLLKGGKAVVTDVPAPGAAAGNLLVRVEASCISVGTEAAGLAAAAMPLYRRALKQPKNVLLAIEMARTEGIARTTKVIRGMLAAGQSTGYSAAGHVVAVGERVEGFAVGDRVACAGAGIANHAELIDVPVNLAAKVPEGVSIEDASSVTLGAIALQGVRRAAPTLGETIVVVGLGILGQLTVQFLKANGCRVVGVDPDAGRVSVAQGCGLDLGLVPEGDAWIERVLWLTDGFGADAAIVTAAGPGHEIISQAMRACRRKGRVVLVGDVGLDLKREDFYRKELDFLVSTSYGPGRYDPAYEEGGQDYPLPYVRWTENRNMDAYLAMLAAGRVRLAPLSRRTWPIDEAAGAFEAIQSPDRPLLAFLAYPAREEASSRTVALGASAAARGPGRIQIALVGAGGFAQGMHLPNLDKLRDRFQLRWVVSRTGATATNVAERFEAAHAGTDIEAALADPEVDLVMIATRHHLHADLVLRSLAAGKHVFVEKPLALNEAELARIEAFYAGGTEGKPVLMTGFNRRFSPAIEAVKASLANRGTPLMIDYRMNAGFLPREHWVHGPEGGGRNIGEACHIYDLFLHLTGAEPVAVNAAAVEGAGAFHKHDNFCATVSLSDGSVATLLYTALGAKSHPKERMEVHADGMTVLLDDYREVTVAGGSGKPWRSTTVEKGQMQELRALGRCLSEGGAWPVSLAAQLQAMRVAFAVEALILAGPLAPPETEGPR